MLEIKSRITEKKIALMDRLKKLRKVLVIGKDITQTETQREKGLKRIGQSIQKLWDISQSNKHGIDMPEGEEKKLK